MLPSLAQPGIIYLLIVFRFSIFIFYAKHSGFYRRIVPFFLRILNNNVKRWRLVEEVISEEKAWKSVVC